MGYWIITLPNGGVIIASDLTMTAVVSVLCIGWLIFTLIVRHK